MHTFPMPRRCPYAPPPEYAHLRDEAPLARVTLPAGHDAWIVLRHDEARAALADTRLSSDIRRPGFPNLAPEPVSSAEEFQEGVFVSMDSPEHGFHRRMLIPEFGLRRVAALRPRIRRAADELIDNFVAGSTVDLVSDYGLPLSSLMICELLGVPYADHAFFQARTREMVSLDGGQEGSVAAAQALRNYLDGLVTEAEHRPGDNLIGRLAARGTEHGEPSHDAIVGMVFLLLVAGHETTANMIPLSVMTLLDHPGQLAALRADEALWPGAVEELLRFHSIADWTSGYRLATADLTIGGHEVRAGDAVFVLNAAANHDERAFEDPGVFDVRRPARHHLAFGYGPHQCLGQSLARAEIEIACRALFERFPKLRLNGPVGELPFKYGGTVHGLNSLPVTVE